MDIRALAAAAKKAGKSLAKMGAGEKNAALHCMADALEKNVTVLLQANAEDMEAARKGGMAEGMLDRLLLTEERVLAMASGLRDVAALADPVGEITRMWLRPNGMQVGEKRVPLGVIAIIYEARPNVTADSIALCIKSGNAVVLRGGSEAIRSNMAIVAVMKEALSATGFPQDAVALVEDTKRETATEMMRLNGLIDVLIPRGGKGLIEHVVNTASVPVIETGSGVCHTYIDKGANLAMGQEIAINAKISRPSVCNSMETLLVHEAVAREFLPACLQQMQHHGVRIFACEKARAIVPGLEPATPENFATEYSALVLNVRVVENIDEAIEHIETYSTRHSECIVTEDIAAADRFLNEVDAAAVYRNVSTRFTDGFEFGFGAEIGISTQKLHARGPMGLLALTSSKYIILGNGQVRK